MPRAARMVLVLGAAALAATTLVGCTASDTQQGDVTPSASASRPVVGECRTYDAVSVEAATEVSAPVPCSGEHTAETFAVADGLPDPGEAGVWTEEQLGAVGSTACGAAPTARYLGSTTDELVATRITPAFFGPTPEQARSGARWVRCDALVFDERDPVLITGRLADLAKVPGAFAQCTTRPPAAAFAAVPCAAGQQLFAAIGAITPDSSASGSEAAPLQACQSAWPTAAVAGAQSRWVVTGLGQSSTLTTPASYLCWLPVASWDVDADRWPAEKPLAPSVSA